MNQDLVEAATEAGKAASDQNAPINKTGGEMPPFLCQDIVSDKIGARLEKLFGTFIDIMKPL
ncbi:hypothetical protein [Halobacillus dabanensis]|uniref:hypothetical protein n=1 Tax=Halobacillus dabanensis TaxID=240302 RepID=UPI000944AD80|nr:hypothetical protein [Halobacillus dabanensis]